MKHWLLKTEPDCYSWEQMLEDGRTHWDDIHNYQARNFLRAMKTGDLAFFYHTGGERRIMGIVKIVKEAYADPEDPTWSWVDVEKVSSLERPISLEDLKNHPLLPADHLLFRQGRLSVVPFTAQEWEMVVG